MAVRRSTYRWETLVLTIVFITIIVSIATF